MLDQVGAILLGQLSVLVLLSKVPEHHRDVRAIQRIASRREKATVENMVVMGEALGITITNGLCHAGHGVLHQLEVGPVSTLGRESSRSGFQRNMWLRSLGGGVFAALRGGLVAAITQDWLQVGVAV